MTETGETPRSGANDPVAPAPQRRPWRAGLSGKLLFLTILFVMVSEILIYVPSIANYRMTWLRDAHATASVAAVVLAEDSELPKPLQARLLRSTDTIAIALLTGERRRLIAIDMPPETVDHHVDLAETEPVKAIVDAFAVLLESRPHTIRVSGVAPGRDEQVEIVISDRRLRAAMLAYSSNILVLSLIISMVTAVLVYMSIRWLLVRPMQRLTGAIAHFAENPEDTSRIVAPSGRNDEIGDAEHRLATMQRQLSETIHQRRRLAELGLAVSKINHDLRNLLASAQLFSDRLASSPDPMVQRILPKMVGALDRAVGYTRSVMSYGSTSEPPPSRRLLRLRRLVDDVGELVGLGQHPQIAFENGVPDGLEVDADPDQLFRVLINLARNAVQILETGDDATLVKRLEITAEREGSVVTIRVADTGPGVPAKVREHLFQPFQASTRKGGTGLGLAISAELVRAHGGSIELTDGAPGAVFEITLPDRPVDLAEVRRTSGGKIARKRVE
ncbi:sensor histidine kinase [Amorphus orientalis]|uniref:histidine kinase n=1 Tax=Amorphus orientalis TaxID=649198 RepID=A0AAE4ATT3_9HYPH|nr:HAMP domain-containing sensor histidine kinase [Amorphus orientalis]MDQ0316663.1 signal transduction histidine kinase [Amorphus orientalis]